MKLLNKQHKVLGKYKTFRLMDANDEYTIYYLLNFVKDYEKKNVDFVLKTHKFKKWLKKTQNKPDRYLKNLTIYDKHGNIEKGENNPDDTFIMNVGKHYRAVIRRYDGHDDDDEERVFQGGKTNYFLPRINLVDLFTGELEPHQLSELKDFLQSSFADASADEISELMGYVDEFIKDVENDFKTPLNDEAE